MPNGFPAFRHDPTTAPRYIIRSSPSSSDSQPRYQDSASKPAESTKLSKYQYPTERGMHQPSSLASKHYDIWDWHLYRSKAEEAIASQAERRVREAVMRDEADCDSMTIPGVYWDVFFGNWNWKSFGGLTGFLTLRS